MNETSALVTRIEQAKSNHQAVSEQMSQARVRICQPASLPNSDKTINDRVDDWVDNRNTEDAIRENERRETNNQGKGDGGGTDWAGTAILKNYLSGGEDWEVINDPKWTEYMKNMPEGVDINGNITPPLEEKVKEEMLGIIPGLDLANISESQSVIVPIDHSFHADGPNGESVNGYEFMHGTDETRGDFQIQGNATITNTGEGYLVTYDVTHSWNDTMDPNENYETDTLKSRASEFLTAGKADAFNFSIAWDDECTIHLDRNGNPVRVEGWPSD